MRKHVVLAVTMAMAGVLATSAPALSAARPASAAGPSPAEKARLEKMRKAADDLDEGADPAAYRKAWEAVLAYGETLYPAGHPELAWLEGELVTADYLQGDVTGALARAERLGARLEAGGPEYRDRRMELANAQVVILMTLSDHDRARKLAAQVLEWRIARSEGKPSSNVAAAYSNYANAEFEFGNFDKAIELVRKANAEDRRHETIPVNAAPRFANLPVFLLQSGRLEEAIEEARATQATLEGFMPKGHPYLATNLNTLARILLTLGRPAEAETVSRKAVDIAVARFGQSQQAVSYMVTVAQALIAQGKTDEAIATARQAADILTKGIGPDAQRTLMARESYADAIAASGDREQAIAILREVNATRDRKLPPFHRDRITGRDQLAIFSFEQGDMAAAKTAQTEAQALRRSTFPAEDIANLTGEARLGAIEVHGGDKAGGLKRVEAAAALLDERLARLRAAGTRRSGLELEIRAAYGWALDAAVTAGDEALAFRLAQRMMESSAGRAVQEEEARSVAGDPQLAELIRERQDAAIELEALLDRQLRLAGRGADAATIEAVAGQRKAAAVRLEQRTAALAARAPQLVAPAGSEPLTLESVREALRSDEALLIAGVSESRTTLFAITRDRVSMAMSPATAQQIATLVTRLRTGISPQAAAGAGRSFALRAASPTRAAISDDRTATGFDFDASARLHDILFPEAIRSTIANRSRLLVAANASLTTLPLAVLAPQRSDPTLRNAHWLIRDHVLVTLPSIASVTSARSTGTGRKVHSFFAVGAPELAPAGTAMAFRSADMARQVRDLPALPATEPELRTVGRALAAPEQSILTGSRATEQAIRTADLTRTNVLAFATHGLMAGDLDGLDEPALVMTPGGSDDGLLTASEIMRLRLAADWVILSACNTAAGGSGDDSGLAGIARAFLYAGGRNLLASHWAVRDDAAAYLSVGTVRKYGRGEDPARALREAMLRMIDKRPFEGAEQPVNWAPFVFVGR
ncbi:CHAT domain-containing protein [Rhizorhabdus wittichii]|uniref:CHAT domain-containing protein n=1 Tax=Rhizorhabdus wittichii TaxID=160791 RepID=A0A975D3A9_9SPHN|nr:CHAT domain-containing tetratricopeptide repeat protein [Rhizorhabdus wittichii]QTH21874.1 CHAT domain-containing protein [Rhizorhabdus wittichii]